MDPTRTYSIPADAAAHAIAVEARDLIAALSARRESVEIWKGHSLSGMAYQL